MNQTACVACGRPLEPDADVHYTRRKPTGSGPATLYFCSATCVADNAELFDE